MSLHVVEKIMTRECMLQVHKLSERHFAGIMGERLRKSCRDCLSIRKSSTDFDRVELHLLHLVYHGIDPDDVGLIKKLAMGSGLLLHINMLRCLATPNKSHSTSF